MSGPIVRTGATPEFSDGWDRIFSDKKSKPKSKKSATSKPKAVKKATKKKAAAKKKTSKK
ncbi:hypothetical protein [Rubinisphaera italica]|uniref:RNA polymerase subunit sigma n=1 Tax=Rubinisphaera italica TaxID=2527969 RepID=A0A5C5XK02_9PLAN|nr:hypothetical protein [Rubinisphaera italica]TWT63546.1 hypothetical protein Pan54_42990 [Rubinisphaera italica]HBN75611.1 hypothetical protein [Planctomycetaceae bacterium]